MVTTVETFAQFVEVLREAKSTPEHTFGALRQAFPYREDLSDTSPYEEVRVALRIGMCSHPGLCSDNRAVQEMLEDPDGRVFIAVVKALDTDELLDRLPSALYDYFRKPDSIKARKHFEVRRAMKAMAKVIYRHFLKSSESVPSSLLWILAERVIPSSMPVEYQLGDEERKEVIAYLQEKLKNLAPKDA